MYYAAAQRANKGFGEVEEKSVSVTTVVAIAGIEFAISDFKLTKSVLFSR
jgi:hypothetical protein